MTTRSKCDLSSLDTLGRGISPTYLTGWYKDGHERTCSSRRPRAAIVADADRSRSPKRVNKIESRIPRQRDDSSCLFAHCHTILYYIHISSDDPGQRSGVAGVVIRCGHTPVANPRTAGGSTATTHHHKLYYMYNMRSRATPIGEDNTPIGDSA